MFIFYKSTYLSNSKKNYFFGKCRIYIVLFTKNLLQNLWKADKIAFYLYNFLYSVYITDKRIEVGLSSDFVIISKIIDLHYKLLILLMVYLKNYKRFVTITRCARKPKECISQLMIKLNLSNWVTFKGTFRGISFRKTCRKIGMFRYF